MSIDLYIGPLIARSGSFGYDTFSRVDGLRGSFRYRRVEEARHDRRAMIAESRRALHIRVHVCETLAEFERSSTARRSADGDAGGTQPRKS
jgi:hypothetical protein